MVLSHCDEAALGVKPEQSVSGNLVKSTVDRRLIPYQTSNLQLACLRQADPKHAALQIQVILVPPLTPGWVEHEYPSVFVAAHRSGPQS